MIRLFIALPLPDEVERKLAGIIDMLKSEDGNVKWVSSQNIHLTAKFLGDTDENLVTKISGEIDRIASTFAPIDCAIDTLGGFPNLRRPRVIWAGISGDTETAVKIAKQIDLAMRKLRFEKEKRPFKAHLTLGRVRQGSRLDRLADFMEQYRLDPIPLRLDRLTLFKSTLTPKGAIYDRLHEAVLGKERLSG
ncbi:MAG: RNA 2',3'-cyclic phosphodiesterase [Candidatus Zixiibacteriota bacterium]|nr:MAG: RNA 2',3'-cyclic phosphodiesterase [candidate division Zixibacteria bacterium]